MGGREAAHGGGGAWERWRMVGGGVGWDAETMVALCSTERRCLSRITIGGRGEDNDATT
jgi:hypothetical protein